MASSSPNHPLLVKVQTIDINTLDFKTSGTFKPRNVTCVEASNLFIFVGVTSGTVYVFSRESLSFKFMIPFKGGKVCCISCAENERDIAIGSIRGQVSVYQLIQQSVQVNTPSSAPVPFFRHLATIEHHKGNEITELHWSPNGRYLFAGDNQGLVSQADVGSLEDSTRSASFSQIILKLKSRVIQVHFFFPFLGVCTVTAVYLCDIENEDFIRVQFGTKEDIHASGLALVLLHGAENVKALTLYMYVSEMASGLLHCFNVKGQLIHSQQIETNSFSTRKPVSTFDPIVDEGLEGFQNKVSTLSLPSAPNISLGKLFVSDDNLLLSVSHNHLYFIEPKEMKLLFWNEEFHRIHNTKLLSNYVFLWSSSKVHVLSLTQALPYAEQLFRTGINEPFERWIQYCLRSIGWEENQLDPELNEKVAKHFRSLFQLNGDGYDEETDFFKFISLRVPFDISAPEQIQEETPKSPWWKSLQKLLAVFAKSEENSHGQFCSIEIWEAIEDFYSGMNLNLVPLSDGVHAQVDLVHVMLNVEAFSSEMALVNVYQELSDISDNNEIQILNDRIFNFFQRLQKWTLDDTSVLAAGEKLETPNLRFFSTFLDQDEVMDWFGDFSITKSELVQDACLADFLLVLTPFLSPEVRGDVVTGFQKTYDGFFTWLLTSTFYNIGTQSFPYELQIKSLFSAGSANTLQFEYAKDILCSIYRDLVQPDFEPLVMSLHHLISVLFFIIDMEPVESGSPKKDIILSLLISCFPLKHWPKEDIEAKLMSLCRKNEVLLQMFQEAALFHHRETQLCRCGIPIDCFYLTSATGPGISSILVTTCEIILEILVQKYFQSTTLDPRVAPSLPESLPFKFAMKTKLLEQFLNDFAQSLSDEMLMEILLRVSSCAFLGKIRMNKFRLKTLLRKRELIRDHKTCETCGEGLVFPNSFTSLPMDCIGICLLNNSNSLEGFRKTVEIMPGLNTSGVFSLGFYQLVAAWTKGNGIGSPNSATNRRGPITSNKLSCDTLHVLATFGDK